MKKIRTIFFKLINQCVKNSLCMAEACVLYGGGSCTVWWRLLYSMAEAHVGRESPPSPNKTEIVFNGIRNIKKLEIKMEKATVST